MKKPVVVWVTQIYLVWFGIGAALRTVLSPVGTFNGGYSIQEGAGGFLIGAGALAGIVLLLLRIARRAVSRRVVVIFLWILLLIYPVMNVLRSIGFFPPHVPIADNELVGAAVAEVVRYLTPLALIVWLSFTKAAAEYLNAARSGNALQAPGA